MNNAVLPKEIIDLLTKEFLYFVVFPTLQQTLFNAISILRAQKYNGYMIANGEFLENIRKTIPTTEEKIDYKGKYQEKVEKIVEYCDSKDLGGLYRNLSSAKISRSPLTMLILAHGAYSPVFNILGYSSKKSFTHEMFHLVSSYYDKITKIEFSGFSQRKGIIRIGDGLNEGYTELLASRVENREVRRYKTESKIATMIEYFFENPKEMQSLYLNHDLPGLANKMSKYTSEKEFLNMLYSIEFSRDKGFAFPITPIPMILAQVKLYEWFSANCKDEKKLAEFEALACKDKMVELIIKRKKMKLCKGGKSLPISSQDLEFEGSESITKKDENKSISDKFSEFIYARRKKIMEYQMAKSIRTQDYMNKTR